jgi:cold shock CspA family protein
MIGYVDEFGKFSSTPLYPYKKSVADAKIIELTVIRNSPDIVSDVLRKVVETFFNELKEFGSISDTESDGKIFVHVHNLIEPARENNLVAFEIGKGPISSTAIKVKQLKE